MVFSFIIVDKRNLLFLDNCLGFSVIFSRPGIRNVGDIALPPTALQRSKGLQGLRGGEGLKWGARATKIFIIKFPHELKFVVSTSLK